MKCNKCGQSLPEDSGFCQYCGAKVEIVEEIVINQEPQIIIKPEKSKENYSKSKFLFWVITLVIMTLIGLNIYQFMSTAAFKTEINTLNKEVAELNKQLDDREEKFNYYFDKYNENRFKASDYDKVIEFLSSPNAGYASNNYYASDSIVVLKKGGSYKSINITCKYYNTTVYSQCSDLKIRAEWSMLWNNMTTSIKIYPELTGVSTVTFTNDSNSESFKVMVIVI